MYTQTRRLSNAPEIFNIVMQNFTAEDKEKVPILAWKPNAEKTQTKCFIRGKVNWFFFF